MMKLFCLFMITLLLTTAAATLQDLGLLLFAGLSGVICYRHERRHPVTIRPMQRGHHREF